MKRNAEAEIRKTLAHIRGAMATTEAIMTEVEVNQAKEAEAALCAEEREAKEQANQPPTFKMRSYGHGFAVNDLAGIAGMETGAASPPSIQDPSTEPLDARMRVDVNRASQVTPAVDSAIDAMFEYHPWDNKQTQDGVQVRLALALAVRVIVERVPPSPDRSAAIRKLREARMDCNSAITHSGRF